MISIRGIHFSFVIKNSLSHSVIHVIFKVKIQRSLAFLLRVKMPNKETGIQFYNVTKASYQWSSYTSIFRAEKAFVVLPQNTSLTIPIYNNKRFLILSALANLKYLCLKVYLKKYIIKVL